MRRALAAILAAACLSVPAAAHGVQLEEADRDVKRVRVVYVEHWAPRHFYVETNDGATYKLRRCRREDSRACVWDAKRRGNGVGRSFAVIHGEVIRIRPRLMRAAY